MSSPKRTAAVFALALGVLGERAARASPRSDTCIAAAETAQLARYHGQLRAAHEGFVSCARSGCPSTIQTDCARWLSEVEASLPTIVLAARWSDGTDVVDARVSIDGAVVDAADGRAIPLDPGEHTVLFAREGARSVSVTVLLREGEKNRAVEATLEKPPPSSSGAGAGKRARELPLPSILLGTLAVIGAGVGTGFYLSGRGGLDDLRGTCGNACRPDDVDDERRKLLVGDVAVAISAVALGVAAYLFFTARPDRTPERR